MPLSERTQKQLDTMLTRWDERERHNALDDVEQYVGDLEGWHFDAVKGAVGVSKVSHDLRTEIEKVQGLVDDEFFDRLSELADDLGEMLGDLLEELPGDLAGDL